MVTATLLKNWGMSGGIAMMLLALQPLVPASGQTAESLSREEVIAMVPSETDVETSEKLERVRKLVEMGEAVTPILADELVRTKDEYLAKGIIRLFIEHHGDRTVAAEAISTYLVSRKDSYNETLSWSPGGVHLLGAITALSVNATPRQADVLFEMVDYPVANVAIYAMATLGQLGDGETARRLESLTAESPEFGEKPAREIVRLLEVAEDARAQILERLENEKADAAVGSAEEPGGLKKSAQHRTNVEIGGNVKWWLWSVAGIAALVAIVFAALKKSA